jgi:hypothetical protein
VTHPLATWVAGLIAFMTIAGCATSTGRQGAATEASSAVGSDLGQAELTLTSKDEASIERQIAKYFTQRGIQAEYREQDGNGRVVVTYLSNGLQWRVILDTTDTSHGKAGRAIGLILDTDYKVDEDIEILKALAVLNNFHVKRWAGTFYFDPSDHEITGQWYINLPSVSVHPEVVVDALKRLSGSWVELHHELEAVLKVAVDMRPLPRGVRKVHRAKGAIDT